MQVPVSQPFHTELNWGSHWRFSRSCSLTRDSSDLCGSCDLCRANLINTTVPKQALSRTWETHARERSEVREEVRQDVVA